jgi:DNA-binding HxlR family transcriptional regulator
MRRKALSGSRSAIARGLDVVGDWWTLLILNEALAGTRRFSDIQKRLDIPRNMLSARLKTMVASNLLKIALAANGSAHHEYEPTEMGRELSSVLVALAQWSADHLFESGEECRLPVDAKRGRPLRILQLRAEDGRLLSPHDIAMSSVDDAR